MKTKCKTMIILSAIALIAAGCSGGGPTRPESGSEADLESSGTLEKKGGNGGGNSGGGGTAALSYDLSGGFTGTYSGPPAKDNDRELSFFADDMVTIHFPGVTETDCTFGANVTTQQVKDNLVALAQQGSVYREVSFVIRKREGTGAVRTRGVQGETAPHTHMCWSTGHGLCPFVFVGTDIDNPETRREFQFAGGGNNHLRLLYSEGSGNSFTAYEAICSNDDPVTVVVEPAP